MVLILQMLEKFFGKVQRKPFFQKKVFPSFSFGKKESPYGSAGIRQKKTVGHLTARLGV